MDLLPNPTSATLPAVDRMDEDLERVEEGDGSPILYLVDRARKSSGSSWY